MTPKDQPLLDENPWDETVVLSIFGAFAGLLLWVGFLDSRHPIVAVPAVLALAAGAAVALRVLEGPQEYWLLDEGIRCRSRKGIELIEYEEISRVEHFKPFRTRAAS